VLDRLLDHFPEVLLGQFVAELEVEARLAGLDGRVL
jgi:hypothetical protein